MTTSEPDDVITAADLLFGSAEDAHDALARHVMSARRTTARAFVRLPRVTREAAVREAAIAAVGLLKVDRPHPHLLAQPTHTRATSRRLTAPCVGFHDHGQKPFGYTPKTGHDHEMPWTGQPTEALS